MPDNTPPDAPIIDETANTAANSIATAAITTLQDMADKDIEDTATMVEELAPLDKIKNITCKVYPHEYKMIADVLLARQGKLHQGKPLTRDMNHFLRQCIRFTLNHKEGMAFWLPPHVQIITIDT